MPDYELDPNNLGKLKVVELKAELQARGLETKGVKNVLIERLQEALLSEGTISGKAGESLSNDDSKDIDNQPEDDNEGVGNDKLPSDENAIPEDTYAPSDNSPTIEQQPAAELEHSHTHSEHLITESSEKMSSDSSKLDESKHDLESHPEGTPPSSHHTSKNIYSEEGHDFKEGAIENIPEEKMDTDVNGIENENLGDMQSADSQDESSIKMETTEADRASDKEQDRHGIKRSRSEDEEERDRSRSRSRSSKRHHRSRSRERHRSDSDNHRRRRSRSRDGHRTSSKSESYEKPLPIIEDEPDFDDQEVLLDWYNSDLNLKIKPDDMTSAEPLTELGFGYIWAGSRATYGFTSGKVMFEVEVVNHLDVSHLGDEINPHVVRIGASLDSCSMQLGEDPKSYGYGGTGKISTECQFSDYGIEFKEGDVIGCFLDLDSEVPTISYSVNGTHYGTAFELDKTLLCGEPLFPHILSKNCGFKVNFGDKAGGPYFPCPENMTGFMFASEVPIELRHRAPKRPEKREDCEIIMMCGLPSSGKTTWAEKYFKEHPEKKFNILGTNALIEKMKIMGVPRKKTYVGRWDVLIDKCTRCLNTLLEMGAKRRRNYILDQTNVYPSARKRKLAGFSGFRKKAIVLVPTEDEYKVRCEKREELEGKDVPDEAVLEMKANFKLPEKGDLFEDVEYVDLEEEEARKLVDGFNKEGKAAGFTPVHEKRVKRDDRSRDRQRPSWHGRSHQRSDHRNSYDKRSNSYRDHSSGGYGGRSGGGGGYKNRGSSSSGSGYRGRGNSGGSSRGRYRGHGSSSGGGGGGSWYRQSDRPYRVQPWGSNKPVQRSWNTSGGSGGGSSSTSSQYSSGSWTGNQSYSRSGSSVGASGVGSVSGSYGYNTYTQNQSYSQPSSGGSWHQSGYYDQEWNWSNNQQSQRQSSPNWTNNTYPQNYNSYRN